MFLYDLPCFDGDDDVDYWLHQCEYFFDVDHHKVRLAYLALDGKALLWHHQTFFKNKPEDETPLDWKIYVQSTTRRFGSSFEENNASPGFDDNEFEGHIIGENIDSISTSLDVNEVQSNVTATEFNQLDVFAPQSPSVTQTNGNSDLLCRSERLSNAQYPHVVFSQHKSLNKPESECHQYPAIFLFDKNSDDEESYESDFIIPSIGASNHVDYPLSETGFNVKGDKKEDPPLCFQSQENSYVSFAHVENNHQEDDEFSAQVILSLDQKQDENVLTKESLPPTSLKSHDHSFCKMLTASNISKYGHQRDFMELILPFKNGVVADWDIVDNIWDHVFKDCMLIDSKEHLMLLAEPTSNILHHMERVAKFMFGNYKAPAVFLAKNAILTSFTSGRTTFLVANSGDGSTTAAVVPDNYIHYHNRVCEKLNGINSIHYFKSQVTNRASGSQLLVNNLHWHVVQDNAKDEYVEPIPNVELKMLVENEKELLEKEKMDLDLLKKDVPGSSSGENNSSTSALEYTDFSCSKNDACSSWPTEENGISTQSMFSQDVNKASIPEVDVYLVNFQQLHWFFLNLPPLSSKKGALLFVYLGVNAEEIATQLIHRGFKLQGVQGDKSQGLNREALHIFSNLGPIGGALKQFRGRVEIMSKWMRINASLVMEASNLSYKVLRQLGEEKKDRMHDFQESEVNEGMIGRMDFPVKWLSWKNREVLLSNNACDLGKDQNPLPPPSYKEDYYLGLIKGIPMIGSTSILEDISVNVDMNEQLKLLMSSSSLQKSTLIDILKAQEASASSFPSFTDIYGVIFNSFKFKMVHGKQLCQEVHKFCGKIMFIIWGWYYKEMNVCSNRNVEDLMMSQSRQSQVHPGNWILEWKIAWKFALVCNIEFKNDLKNEIELKLVEQKLRSKFGNCNLENMDIIRRIDLKNEPQKSPLFRARCWESLYQLGIAAWLSNLDMSIISKTWKKKDLKLEGVMQVSEAILSVAFNVSIRFNIQLFQIIIVPYQLENQHIIHTNFKFRLHKILKDKDCVKGKELIQPKILGRGRREKVAKHGYVGRLYKLAIQCSITNSFTSCIKNIQSLWTGCQKFKS